MIIDEKTMMNTIEDSKKTLLIEPPYRKKYIPLGLSKISSALKEKNKEVKFVRKFDFSDVDTIYMTTLFTYYSKIVTDEIDSILEFTESKFFKSDTKLIIGGIFASLMYKYLEERYSRNKNLFIFTGYSKILDSYMPDYDLDNTVDEKWKKFSEVFTTRGCVNSCGYCAVPRLEKEFWINEDWKKSIDMNKPYIMIHDNNITSHNLDHFEKVISFSIENDKRLLFDNGFDNKFITKETAKLMSTAKYCDAGVRLAFDRIEEDGSFQTAVRLLQDAKIPNSKLFAYVLFNFNDKPKDAIYRFEECIRLKIRPYPQAYTPLNHLDKKVIHIGKNWTYSLRNAIRFFFLMRSLYANQSFYDWIKKQDKFEITDEDYQKLYNGE